MGRLASSQQLDLALGLPLRNQDELNRLVQELYDPASTNYHRYLTPEQFAERFGPTEADYQKLMAFAKANNLAVTATHPNRTLLDVKGTAADVEKACRVSLRLFQHPTEARAFYAPDAEPSLDLDIPVLAISGLDNYVIPHPMDLKSYAANQAVKAMAQTGSGPSNTYVGNDFRAAYAPGVSLTGAGQSVGLLEFDGYNSSDIAAYKNLAGLPEVALTNILLDGFNGNSSISNSEVPLDIEMVLSMAPGLSAVIIYETSTNDSGNDLLNRMATDNLAKQLSSSWTFSINPSTPQIFLQFAAQGQSYFNASGDSGAYNGDIPPPVDQTNITCVGGTTLTTTGPGGAWASETVWNWNSTGQGTGASGGGISTNFLIPSWQQDISMSANKGSTTERNIPDVAMVADNIWVLYNNGSSGIFGGTSVACPLWAGFTALVNEQAVDNGNATVGFLNPAIYAIGKGSSYASAFHDITTGNNTNTSSPSKFHAVAGYDLCTGWGTPQAASLISLLAVPTDALRITPGTGFTATGRSGGPFSVNAQTFSLTNAGAASLNWTLGNTSSWLNASATSGTLAPHSPAVSVKLSLNSAASNLLNGVYTATVWFTNLNSGVAQSRAFSLTIGTVTSPSLPALQSALALGGTIDLDFDGTITTTNVLQITKDTILDATGQQVVISGNSSNAIFKVSAGVTFSITNLTLANGNSDGGNGANGATNVQSGNVGNNASNGTNGLGGAIYNQGTNYLISCTFMSNSATGGNGGIGGNPPSGGSEGGNGGNGGAGYGGAIYNLRYVVLSNCTFVGNSAIGGNGGTSPSGTVGPGKGGAGALGAGAAIYNSTNATLAVYSCSFSNNFAQGGASQEGGGPISGNFGNNGSAGAPAEGGVICNLGTNLLSSCQFLGNTATGGQGGPGSPGSQIGGQGGNGGAGEGGCLYNTNLVIITNCTFASGVATGGDGGAGGGGPLDVGVGGTGGLGAGAAIFNVTNATIHIFASTFNNNSAQGGASQKGGGSISGNIGNPGVSGGIAEGGAICNLGTNTAVNCTFDENAAQGGQGGAGGPSSYKGGTGGTGGNAYGGGLFNNGLVSVTNCTFADGAVAGGPGGGGGVGTNSVGSSGPMGTGFGANIENKAGTFDFKNSILAYPAEGTNANGTIIDQGFNISSDGSPAFGTNSHNRLDPKLMGLANNGGPTETMALTAGSPAIDAIFDASAPPFDQRGVPRPFGPRSDIGAFEFNGTNGTGTNIISGQITMGTNAYMGAVVVAVGGNSFSTQTDASGNYNLALPSGSYVVTPQPGGRFNPASLSVVLSTNVTGVNFSVANAAAAITANSAGSNSVQLSFLGIPNINYTIQTSTNLINWQDIATISSQTNGAFFFSDSTTNFARRFYRAVP